MPVFKPLLRSISAPLATLLTLSLLAGCSEKKEKPKTKPPVPVTVAAVTVKSVPVELRAIGNVEAYATVAVKSQVAGRVESVHFAEGEDVAKGALLFKIDSRPFGAELAQAEAALKRDQAKAAHAREQARRYLGLVKDGIVTQEQYDQLRTDADALSASVAADRAAVESSRLQLSYCAIRAPMAGRTGNLAVHPGNLIKANEAPHLVTLNQISPLYVTFSLPEKELAGIKARMKRKVPVQATLPSGNQPAEQGVLTFLDNAVDPATGTIKLKATFQNKERRLWPGQFVNLAVTLDVRPNAVVVPTKAIQTGQQGEFVYLVQKDHTVELRPIGAGVARDGLTVVEKGLLPGDTVVTDGQLRLSPGARISVKSGSPA